MDDPDATLPISKSTPPSSEVPAASDELTDSQVRGMFGAYVPGSPAGQGPRSWQPPSVEELQRALPQYEVQSLIARGGMGAVYKGTQKTLRRAVAIKVLPPDLVDDDMQFAGRFKHEAQAMAQLSHPGIVAVFDAGETPGGLLYFVMEFIEGTDLAQLIASEGRINPQRALSITSAVCEALAFAHESGIIHRDIKPSNIMLDKKGRVKVADFGLAKAVNLESTLLTGSNVSMGTPDFIAPEALIAGMKVDERADLYAVGVMLYQMLTGNIPRGRFQLPSRMLPGVDPGFDAIVDKAMQTDREQRYSTAIEMRTDVERIATRGLSREPRLPDALPQTETGSGKPRSLAKPLLIAIAAMVIALAGVGWWILPAGHSPLVGSIKSDQTQSNHVASAETGLPAVTTPVWQKIPLPSAEALESSLGAEVTSAGELILPKTLTLNDIQARNIAVRGEVKRLSDWPAASVDLRVGSEDTKKDAGFRQCALFATDVWLQLKVENEKFATLSRIPYPSSVDKNQWMLFEFAAIDDASLATLGGVPLLPTGHSPEGQQAGKVRFLYGQFRKLEYINLDGLPEAEALKLAGLGSMKQSPPTPIWQKIPLPDRETLATSTGAAVNAAGEIILPGGKIKVPGIKARNIAIRGEVKRNADIPLSPAIQLRYLATAGDTADDLGECIGRQFQLSKDIFWLQLHLKGNKFTTLSVIHYPPSVDPASWIPFEFATVEDASLAIMAGIPLLPAGRAPEVQEAGNIRLQSGQFRKLEYINLDGLPEAEALKLAGMVPTATVK